MTDYPYLLTIEASISSDYSSMHKGYSDGLCVIGFADCEAARYGVPYRLQDINEALSIFSGTDTVKSSLIQGMMEVYQTGCRDIWLYPVGDMTAAAATRDAAFWSDLYSKYEDALAILQESNNIDILVPYDADITQQPFVQLFANHCASSDIDGVRMVYFSYNGPATTTFTGENKHVVLVNGTGTFRFINIFDTTYSSSMGPSFAGLVSGLPTNVPPDNRRINGPFLFTSDYLDDETTLESNKIVGFRTTVGYERVHDGTLVSTLSFTRAEDNSDYGSLYTMHTVQRFIRGVYALDLIGSAVNLAEESIKEYFNGWTSEGNVRAIEGQFIRRGNVLYVYVKLYMHYPLGDIDVGLKVGPVV